VAALSTIAIIGMACQYPDAASPQQLWENAIAGRRAFRRIPDERLPLAHYWSADPTAPDRAYATNAAVIEGYEFDRVRYRIAGRTFRSTDLTHWLALDVAAQALADAGFPDGGGLPRARTGVVVGNSLTGEFARANVLRLRWPYVRRTVAAALAGEDWDPGRVAEFLGRLEADYKSPFPPIDEDTLAGGLSNTIAGRICGYFDLKGGGYTVDGACSSSLLSVATACTALVGGDLDVALAGGVDLSIDPFEFVGFAKTGALARREMRVYDRGSNGFWPGEGCGMLVLMREPDAVAAGHRVYATIAGWGVSSDGSGSITRPTEGGYRLALDRAYERAGFGVDTVPVFEGHGTGTQVGDTTELRALSEARRAADPDAAPAAISSVKTVIGHTKAAAGVAGLIKATMAVHEEVVPPTVGCLDPHPVLAGPAAALRVLRTAEPWPAGAPVRAGVTSMGFGGINTHIVVTKTPRTHPHRRALPARTRALAASAQDVELILLDAGSPAELRDQVARLAEAIPARSYAQLGDIAAQAARKLAGGPYRAAVVAADPEDAGRQLRGLLAMLDRPLPRLTVGPAGMLGQVTDPGRIGYLFPGQGTGRVGGAGALRRRLSEVDALYDGLGPLPAGDPQDTAVAQPRIVTGTAAGLRALAALGIEAEVAVGHSLGELSALHWAGALDEAQLLRVAAARGAIIAERSTGGGAMAGVAAPARVVLELIGDLPVVVAGYNGPEQTVVSGPTGAVEELGRRARAAQLTSTVLAVSHAFHSSLVAPAGPAFRAWLSGETFASLGRRVISTITGAPLPDSADLAELLERQITAPVLFAQAVDLAAKDADLFIEVGAGRVVTGLAAASTDVPVVPLDTEADSLRGLLEAAGAAYVLGAAPAPTRLFDGRLTRPVRIDEPPKVFANPCETGRPRAAGLELLAEPARDPAEPTPAAVTAGPAGSDSGSDAGSAAGSGAGELGAGGLELLRRLVAERAELPVELVTDDSRLLDGLHLSSITVGTIYTEVARRLGVPSAQPPTNVATASLAELAEALDGAAGSAGDRTALPLDVAGAASWVRGFRVDLDPRPLPLPAPAADSGPWRVYGPGHALAAALRAELERAGVGPGVLVCLPPRCEVDDLGPALDAAKAAALAGPGIRALIVQTGSGAAGLAKSLRQEAPQVQVTVVHLPPPPWTLRRVVSDVVAEVAATEGFSETYHDGAGGRLVPTLRALPARAARTSPPLDGSDVLLVTGGGKGITAECALALATDSGARLALLGRSDPEQDAELAANLRRIEAAGVTVGYARADVGDPAAVRAAVAALTGELGPVSAVLHGAGRNVPTRLSELDLAEIRDTVTPKVDGLRAVLAAVDPDRLRLLVSLGSIIGRAGLRGEGHYAIANDWLADLTREFAERHPRCRTRCLEWSVWSGIGMGERLAVADALARDGITAITPDQGLAVLRRLVADPEAPTVVVISGRTGSIDTIRREEPELPLLRFVDRPLVRYHGVELVSETELDPGTDLYLEDHVLDGDLLFPAVLGLEAMAQVAAAATGQPGVPVVEDLELLRPITVRPDGATTIRIAAAATDDRTVAVAVRSAATGFATEHFRARFRYGDEGVLAGPPGWPAGDELPPVPLDPGLDLYGGLLFQGPLFQRLLRYHALAAREVDAEMSAGGAGGWFARFLPAELLLGDPGSRDALMHGIQVCVPDATLLPTGVDRIQLAAWRPTGGTLRVRAVERRQDGESYTYDLAVRDETGRVVERWDGLRLQAVRKQDGRGPWPAPLLGPYLERRLEDLLGVRLAVAVQPDSADAADAADAADGDGADRGRPALPPAAAGHVAARRSMTALAARRAGGGTLRVDYRPDGRPEVGGGRQLSASHGAGLTLCVVADRVVACDVEPVAARPEVTWQSLLGRYAAIADLVAADEDLDTAATRLWAAAECLRKVGQPDGAPLTPVTGGAGAWRVFASGPLRIATLATAVGPAPVPVVLAVLAERRS
jgi:enediyne polyketide synthase